MPSLFHRRHLRRRLYALRSRLEPLGRRPWRELSSTLLIVCLVCVVSYSWPASHPSARPGKGVVAISSDHPSEAPITKQSYHSTATGTEPKYLEFPSIKTAGYVQKVGIDQRRQVAVPTNIHLAGWFTQSAPPGDPGLSVIDGHLDGYHQPGIFAHLSSLKPGDHFSLELGNGSIIKYKILTVQSLPLTQAAGALFSQTPGVSRQLNLVTCGGSFKTSSGYDQRVIVTSMQI